MTYRTSLPLHPTEGNGPKKNWKKKVTPQQKQSIRRTVGSVGQSTTGFMKGAAKRKKEESAKKAAKAALLKSKREKRSPSRLRGLAVPTRGSELKQK